MFTVGGFSAYTYMMNLNNSITVPPDTIPSYGWVVTRLEQVRNMAYGENIYEITLHYKAWHDNLNRLENVEITVELPDGVTPVLYTGLEYDGIKLIKSIASVSTSANCKEVFTVRTDGTKSEYTINSNVKIGDNPDNYTSSAILVNVSLTDGGGGEPSPKPSHPPAGGGGGGGGSLALEDSYIITTEEERINRSPSRDFPTYTVFVDIDKNAGEFKICTKLTDSATNVEFIVLGNSYPAILNSSGYWAATITGLNGYGEADIVIVADGRQTQAGKLLLLFAE